MSTKSETPARATDPGQRGKRSDVELADLRAALARLRARLMAEPQDRPDVMDAAILDVEIMVDDLAIKIDNELPR